MTELSLEDIGWNPFFQAQLAALAGEYQLDAADDEPSRVAPYRVVIEYQDRYRLLGADGHAWGQMTGNLLRAAMDDRLCRPAVGDWVLMRGGGGEEAMGTVLHLLARKTRFIRQAAGRRIGPQVVAANIDAVFVVTSFNQDFNIRRLERYLTTIESSGARPVLIINKRDLCTDKRDYFEQLATVAADVPTVTSNALAMPGGSQNVERDSSGDGAVDGDLDDELDDDRDATVNLGDDGGLAAIRAHIRPHETVAFVGSSGVGKSTIINRLLGRSQQAVGDIRERDGRGRHTTTHRELIVMTRGGVLIDTPGMRELKLWRPGEGLLESFPEIAELAKKCQFRDCNHGSEPGCAVAEAVASGRLARSRLESYSKLAREDQAAEARQATGLANSPPPSRQRKPKKRR